MQVCEKWQGVHIVHPVVIYFARVGDRAYGRYEISTDIDILNLQSNDNPSEQPVFCFLKQSTTSLSMSEWVG